MDKVQGEVVVGDRKRERGRWQGATSTEEGWKQYRERVVWIAYTKKIENTSIDKYSNELRNIIKTLYYFGNV